MSVSVTITRASKEICKIMNSDEWEEKELKAYEGTSVNRDDIRIGYKRLAYIFRWSSPTEIRSTLCFGVDLQYKPGTIISDSSSNEIQNDFEEMAFLLQTQRREKPILRVKDYIILLSQCRLLNASEKYSQLVDDWRKVRYATKAGMFLSCGWFFAIIFGKEKIVVRLKWRMQIEIWTENIFQNILTNYL